MPYDFECMQQLGRFWAETRSATDVFERGRLEIVKQGDQGWLSRLQGIQHKTL